MGIVTMLPGLRTIQPQFFLLFPYIYRRRAIFGNLEPLAVKPPGLAPGAALEPILTIFAKMATLDFSPRNQIFFCALNYYR